MDLIQEEIAQELANQGIEFSPKSVSASDFALRFAALLQVEPDAHFDNHKIAEFSRDIFGHSAGHAREAYDAAEAGMNIYIQRTAPDLSDFATANKTLLTLQGRMPRQKPSSIGSERWVFDRFVQRLIYHSMSSIT